MESIISAANSSNTAIASIFRFPPVHERLSSSPHDFHSYVTAGNVYEPGMLAGGVRLDLARHRVTRLGRDLHLGPTEFKLLRVLMERPGRVFGREQLLDRVWGRDIHVELRTVDAQVRRLRKALNAGGGADVIRTVRGAGYAFEAEKDEAEKSEAGKSK